MSFQQRRPPNVPARSLREPGAIAALWSIMVMGALIAGLALHRPSASAQPRHVAATTTTVAASHRPQSTASSASTPIPAQAQSASHTSSQAAAPPPALQNRLNQIARRFGQPVGIAVRDVSSGWTASVNGQDLFPQQSVSKLWVALTVLDQVDRGLVHLNDDVFMGEQDRSVFFQPLSARIGPQGLTVTVAELLRHALVESDNSANDRLIRLAGGPQAVADCLRRKGLSDLRVGAPERELQASIAGLDWQTDYGKGRAFQAARSRLPPAARQAALDAYLARPLDGVAPDAIARALSGIRQGRLLSAASTEVLLDLMREARTGPRRLKGGLPRDWQIAHKTGTGPDWRGASVGINDVGLLTAPDGRAYAVAVMIRQTSRAVPVRLEMMQAVSKAVVEAWREGA